MTLPSYAPGVFMGADMILRELDVAAPFDINSRNHRELVGITAASSQISFYDFYGKSNCVPGAIAFDTPGTYTWPAPRYGVLTVEVWGGGGGGGGYGDAPGVSYAYGGVYGETGLTSYFYGPTTVYATGGQGGQNGGTDRNGGIATNTVGGVGGSGNTGGAPGGVVSGGAGAGGPQSQGSLGGSGANGGAMSGAMAPGNFIAGGGGGYVYSYGGKFPGASGGGGGGGYAWATYQAGGGGSTVYTIVVGRGGYGNTGNGGGGTGASGAVHLRWDCGGAAAPPQINYNERVSITANAPISSPSVLLSVTGGAANTTFIYYVNGTGGVNVQLDGNGNANVGLSFAATAASHSVTGSFAASGHTFSVTTSIYDDSPSVPASCFLMGSPVVMADGTIKMIEDITIGEWVRGAFGEHNQVLALDRPMLGNRHMYNINGEHQTTAEHNHLTESGLFGCVSLAESQNEKLYTHQEVITEQGVEEWFFSGIQETSLITQFELGNRLKTTDGYKSLDSMEPLTLAPETQLYNLVLSGSHTYYVQGYCVTGFGQDYDFDYRTWQSKGTPWTADDYRTSK